MNRSLANVIFGGYSVAKKGPVELCDTETQLCHTEIDINGGFRIHQVLGAFEGSGPPLGSGPGSA